MLEKYGITTNHEKMDNGELRFRLISDDGSSYIRTVAPSVGVWQKSHSHSTLTETYIVQKGWIKIAELENENVAFNKVCQGEIYSTRPNVPHNLYMSQGTVLHCVKHGNLSVNDWNPCPALDELIKKF
ncbi:MAG: hypothetical protein FWC00_02375 [Firmicutes bacterium]|nr:hypothetical protein [Bacillota bacterium]